MYHPIDALFDLQRALDSRLDSGWLSDTTSGTGAFPPINVFQQADDLLAIIELPGVDKSSLQVEAKENTIRIAGKKVAVCPVLRAGLGMLDGVLSLVSSARVGFIGLYRDEETLQPVEYYVKLPELGDGERDAIVLDPMLATGRSSAAAVTAVKQAGARSVTLVCLVAAPEGIDHMQSEHPDVRIVTAAVDRELNERGYILPGLGDAGDRLYGTK